MQKMKSTDFMFILSHSKYSSTEEFRQAVCKFSRQKYATNAKFTTTSLNSLVAYFTNEFMKEVC